MANTVLTENQLDLQTYKESLKAFLQEQDVFRDYNFEGSTINALIGLLAYNTYLNALYQNQIGSEMFNDTAQLRDSVVSHAKELNYTPRSRSSSSIALTLSITANDSPDVIVVPQFYEIVGTDRDGNKFYFNTPEAVIVNPVGNNQYQANITFYEGNVVREVFVANTSNRYVLNSANVDTSSISVIVQNSNTDTANTSWERAETLFGLDGDSEVFFIQGAADEKFELVFGNGIVGKQLDNGNLIRVTYRETMGEEANGIETFNAEFAVEGYAVTLTVPEDGLSIGGGEREGIEEIRFNAPRYFATQERAVTASDFIALIRSRFPSLEVVTAYGGEDANPPQYGKVIISAKPFEGTVVPETLRNQILSYIRPKTSLGLDPIFVEPDYYHVVVESVVTYDVAATTKTFNQLATEVTESIMEFNSSYLSNFGSDLRYSKLVKAIDETDTSIISNDTRVKISKRIEPELGTNQNFTLEFGNELYGENVRFQHPEGHDPIVYSGAFTYTVAGIDYTSYIQDDGDGTLFIYTLQNEERVVLNNNVGTVDYETGTVTISGLNVTSYTGDNIKVYARLENADILTDNNKILLIEEEDVSVTMNGIRV